MTKIVYIGPLRSPLDDRGDIEISDRGQWARAGEPVEVDDDLAAQLLDQPTNWAKATTKATAAATETGGK